MSELKNCENRNTRQLMLFLANSDISDAEFDDKLKGIFSERVDEVVDYTIKSLGDKYDEVIDSLTAQLEEAKAVISDIREYVLTAESKAYEYEYSGYKIITRLKYVTQNYLTKKDYHERARR